jgi:diacylglycerol kinase family enzyme
MPGGRRGLHVMIIRERSGARTLALALAAAARGTKAVARTPALDAFVVDTSEIEPHVPRIAVDGEIVRVTPPLVYRHVPGKLRVVVQPPDAPHTAREYEQPEGSVPSSR